MIISVSGGLTGSSKAECIISIAHSEHFRAEYIGLIWRKIILRHGHLTKYYSSHDSFYQKFRNSIFLLLYFSVFMLLYCEALKMENGNS